MCALSTTADCYECPSPGGDLDSSSLSCDQKDDFKICIYLSSAGEANEMLQFSNPIGQKVVISFFY